MSLKSMTEAIASELLTQMSETVFVDKFVHKSSELKAKIEGVKDLEVEEINEAVRELFHSRYRAVHDIAIAINEFLDRSGGAIPIQLDREVEWQGYINGTEESITCLLAKDTQLHMLEFLEAPAEGLIFQLTYGEGAKGKHFNIPMDDVLSASSNLVELVQMAQNLRIQDRLDGIDTDTMIQRIEKDVKEELEEQDDRS